jgi:hypothetical protein
MGTVMFGPEVFQSEHERNAYVFRNKTRLLGERVFRLSSPLFWGFLFGMVFGIWNSSWAVFWAFIAGLPVVSFVMKERARGRVRSHAREYEEFLVGIEQKIRDSILKKYISNRSTGSAHVSDLTNLINHKLNVSLSDEDTRFILLHTKKENTIRWFVSEISKLDGTGPKDLAQFMLGALPNLYVARNETYGRDEGELSFAETRLFNENNGSHMLEYYSAGFREFHEALERLSIEYNSEDVEKEFLSLYKIEKAQNLELDLETSREHHIKSLESLDGIEFEAYIADLFKRVWPSVEVTKKTGDQGADIILEDEGIKTAVQVKKYSGKVSNSAVQEVVAATKYYGCEKAMVVTNSQFTKSAIELAKKNGVTLVDGDKIEELRNHISTMRNLFD